MLPWSSPDLTPRRGLQRNVGTLPPWSWFWLGCYLTITLPAAVANWSHNLKVILRPLEGADALSPLGSLGEVLPSMAIFVGVLTVASPWPRAAYLRWRYRLRDPRPSDIALSEVREFLDHHAPGIDIKVNMLWGNQVAFVYPVGFHRSGIAVFGGLLRLWRSDRPAAEAVLLHELAHAGHGDALIVGAGSLLEVVARNWLVILGVSLIPLAITFLRLATRPSLTTEGLLSEIDQIYLPFVFYPATELTLLMAATVVVPVIGMWCAELSADRHATIVQGTTESLGRALKPRRGGRGDCACG